MSISAIFLKELRCQEEEIKREKQKQKQQQENLQKREQELDAREMELLGRELNIMITQNTPTPKKRRGKFSKTKLKVIFFICLTFFTFHDP